MVFNGVPIDNNGEETFGFSESGNGDGCDQAVLALYENSFSANMSHGYNNFVEMVANWGESPHLRPINEYLEIDSDNPEMISMRDAALELARIIREGMSQPEINITEEDIEHYRRIRFFTIKHIQGQGDMEDDLARGMHVGLISRLEASQFRLIERKITDLKESGFSGDDEQALEILINERSVNENDIAGYRQVKLFFEREIDSCSNEDLNFLKIYLKKIDRLAQFVYTHKKKNGENYSIDDLRQ
jgi:hypothetical protein